MRVFSHSGFSFGVGIVVLFIAVGAYGLDKVDYSGRGYSETFQVSGTAPIGNLCSTDEDCLGYLEKVECKESAGEKRCSCNVEHVQVEATAGVKTCERIQNEIGKQCVDDRQCTSGIPGDLSVCLDMGESPGGPKYCQCQAGAVRGDSQDHKCYRIRENFEDECVANTQCRFTMGRESICEKPPGACRCNTSLSIPSPPGSPGGDKCLPIRQQLGMECQVKEQCTMGSPGPHGDCVYDDEDKKMKCVCQDGWISSLDKTTCLEIQNQLGDLGCNQEAVSNLGGLPGTRCIAESSKIGDPCTVDAQCVGIPGFTSTCFDSYCACLPRYTSSIDRNDCLLIQNNKGDTCEEDNQCKKGALGDLSGCFKEKCDCAPEAISDPSDVLCQIKATKVGGPCNTDSQCTANLELSYCMDDKCVCDEDTVESGNGDKCLEEQNLGGSCVDDNQCTHVDHAICNMTGAAVGICQCGAGYVTHPNKKSCMQLAALIGDSCKEDLSQCRNLYEGGAECNVNTDKCDCPAVKPVVSLDKTKCLDEVNALKGTCEESQQCKVDGSVCTEGLCSCDTTGYLEFDRKCLPILTKVNDTCEQDVQCFFIGKGDTVKCREDKCQCDEGSKYSQQFERCLNPAGLGQQCEFHDECHFGVNNLTVCIPQGSAQVKRCSCIDKAFPWSGSCWLQKYNGDSCTSDQECGMTYQGPAQNNRGLVCKSGKCTCKQGTHPDSAGWGCNSANNLGLSFFIIFLTLALVTFNF